ncbi:hypothetical protein ABPG75_003440 [Micractinium tetrahymenae]
MRTLLLALSAACCLLAAAAQPLPAPLQRQDVSLPPFVEVDLCAPISTLIVPNTTGGYWLTIEAEPSVIPALSYAVVNGALHLETQQGLNTTRPIKLTVSLPATALQAVSHQGPGAELFVAPGFVVPSFTATASFAAGRLYVSGMQAQVVTHVLSSTGDVVLAGSFGTVNATSTGTGSIYIAGVNGTTLLDMRGVSDVFVVPASPTATITGRAQGLNIVQYTTGTCTVQSVLAPGLLVCHQVPLLVLPVANPVWTCGIASQGSFVCSTEGLAYTSAGGVDTSSGGLGSFPTSAIIPTGQTVTGPGSYFFSGASPAGPGTGTQQQAGMVTPGSTTAASQVAGAGPVSAVSVAGPAGAQTSTTQGGLTTSFQTGGAQPGAGGASATASSTAFASASSSAIASALAGTPAATAIGGAVRVGPGGSRAISTSEACQAYPLELAMPTGA